jgi:hypothetical protein
MATSRRRHGSRLPALAVLLCVFPGAGAARAQDATVSASVNVRLATGTFGSSQTTDVVYAPATVRVDWRRFEFSASVPFVSVMDGTVLWSGGGYIPMQGSMSGAPGAGVPMGANGMMGGMMGTSQPVSPGAGGTSTNSQALLSASGLGDIILASGYRLIDRSDGLQVVVGTRVKLPTASASKGLGTGETDVAATVSLRRRLDHGWFYADAGFVKVGEPAGVTLRNAALWGVGGGRRLAARVFLLASAYGNTATIPEFGASAEFSAGIGIPLTTRVSITVMPVVGLTNASPKYGVTFGITNDLTRR